MSFGRFPFIPRRFFGGVTFAFVVVACSHEVVGRRSSNAAGAEASGGAPGETNGGAQDSGGDSDAAGAGGTSAAMVGKGGSSSGKGGSSSGKGGSSSGKGGSSSSKGGSSSGIGGSSSGIGGSSSDIGGSSSDIGGSSSDDAGSGPIPLGTCDGLPAPGTWEEITPNASAMQGSNALAVDPFDAGTLWLSAGTQTPGGIYKSTDCGTSWTLVSTGENSDAVNAMGMTSMVVDPVNRGTIYASPGSNGGAGIGLWKSTDGGQDWTQLFPPDSEVAQTVQFGLVGSIGMEAANPSHLVIGMHAACNPPYGPVCEAETTDGGLTWTITTVAIPNLTDWVGGEGAFILDANTWLFGTFWNGLWLTKDRGATWQEVTAPGAEGAAGGQTLNAPFVKAADGHYYLADINGVNQSADGETWNLLPNSGGRSVGLATGPRGIYTGDGWSNNYHSATFRNLAAWTAIAPPSTQPDDQGSQFMGFDSTNSVLYTSNWSAGAWRMVVTRLRTGVVDFPRTRIKRWWNFRGSGLDPNPRAGDARVTQL